MDLWQAALIIGGLLLSATGGYFGLRAVRNFHNTVRMCCNAGLALSLQGISILTTGMALYPINATWTIAECIAVPVIGVGAIFSIVGVVIEARESRGQRQTQEQPDL